MANEEHLEILTEDDWQWWRESNPGARPDLSGADLRGFYLGGIDLTDTDFRRADLTSGDLNGSNLAGADLSGANLGAADLRGVVGLADADFTRADLTGACLIDADLSGASFSGANLSNADLRYADLSGSNLAGVDLSGANLGDANLTGADLGGANLAGANLSGTKLTGVDLRNADLTSLAESAEGVGSFLDLATCPGIEEAIFSNSDFLPSYLARAFEYCHRSDTEDARKWPGLVSKALKRIRALRALLPDSEPPPEIVDLTREISAELIRYLAKHPEALYEIQPRQFEELIAEILASYGWEIHLTPATRDGGYDLFAISKDVTGVRTSWIIECKKYRQDRKVGIDVARGLYSVKTDLKVASMMLATTSYFSKDVHAYKASRYDLELRDYEGVLEWLNEYKPNPKGRLYVRDHRLVMPGDEE